MQLLFVTHYFDPEVGAAQTRISETVQRLSARGHKVTVLTGFPNYPDGVIPKGYRGHVLLREQIGGVRVIRSAVYPAPSRGFSRRLVNHASFALSSVLASPLAGKSSVVIAESPPLLTAVAAVPIARTRRAPLVLNVSELWPESAVQLGTLRHPRAIAIAEALELFAYRHSASITVPTAGMRSTLLDRGEPADKVTQLPNAVDVDRFALDPNRDNQQRRVIYCGTGGMAQGVGTLIDAAAELASSDQDFEFVVVGDGAERAELVDKVRRRGLTNVRFVGRVEREAVPELIASADIAVLCLRDVPLFENALPTKVLEYMAAGRPVVASAAGDVPRLLERAEAGIACRPEDPAALAAAISRLASSPERARVMGANGRRYVRAHHSREAFVSALEAIISRLVGDELERARIRRVYHSIEANRARRRSWSATNPGNRRITTELYETVREALAATGNLPSAGRVLLDVGCGYGDVLSWLREQGADADCLRGVDILEERVTAARARLPEVAFDVADARALPCASDSVNAVLLFTVLSSVLRRADRLRVASEAIRVLRPGGVILCYDMRYWSPRNRTVRPIGQTELGRLFPRCTIETRSLTLLPPLARRLGRSTEALYGPLSAVPLLRAHLVAVVRPALA